MNLVGVERSIPTFLQFTQDRFMNLLFPQNPSMRKLPEPIFEPEYDAAKSFGFNCLLFDEEALCAGDIDLALTPGNLGNAQLA